MEPFRQLPTFSQWVNEQSYGAFPHKVSSVPALANEVFTVLKSVFLSQHGFQVSKEQEGGYVRIKLVREEPRFSFDTLVGSSEYPSDKEFDFYGQCTLNPSLIRMHDLTATIKAKLEGTGFVRVGSGPDCSLSVPLPTSFGSVHCPIR